ncbi:hypothetical protein [Gymnodinialimonas hymeniacidonis]|uniref:hypothetical protein n=1 Tax=Gymnodinialimonas hymeniacidonis TaxID=3126508 RepID=UPI0034C604EE
MPSHLSAILLGISLSLIPVSVAQAQTEAAAEVAERYISRGGGLLLSDTYTYDEGITERFDIDVPVRFRVYVPRFDGVTVRDFLLPDGGAFAAFQFTYVSDETTEQGLFLENFQVTTANIPMAAEADDPLQMRADLAAQLLREQIFPSAIGAFPEGELLVLERVELGNVPNAVQMIGSHIRPESGGRELVRAVIFPHPDQVESLMAVSRINLTLVPAVDAETLAASITGHMMSEWEYLGLSE